MSSLILKKTEKKQRIYFSSGDECAAVKVVYFQKKR